MDTKDKREGWLRDLKVGDKVLVRAGRYMQGTVMGITATGMIDVYAGERNAVRYNAHGIHRTGDKWNGTIMLYAYEGDAKAEYELQQLKIRVIGRITLLESAKSRIQSTNFGGREPYTPEQLNALNDALAAALATVGIK